MNFKEAPPADIHKIESIIKGPVICGVMTIGIDTHVLKLDSCVADPFGNRLDTGPVKKQFSMLYEAFSTGFQDLQRRTVTISQDGTIYFSYANPKDIYKKDPSKLNTAPGKTPTEILISVGRYHLGHEETVDPREVFTSKGIQVAVRTQTVRYDRDQSKTIVDPGAGYSIRMSEAGGCTGIGTMWTGVMEHWSDFVQNLSHSQTDMVRQELSNTLVQ